MHPTDTSSQPRTRIARTADDLLQACHLIHDAYVAGGLARPDATGLRVTPFQRLTTSDVIVLDDHAGVRGTVTLVADNDELGLPMESLFGDLVEARRAAGIPLAEASCLAEGRDPDRRSISGIILLMALLAQRAVARGIDQLLITVHPHHATFYERFCAFQRIGETRDYDLVLGREAVPLALDFPSLPRCNPRVHRRFFGNPFPATVLCQESVSDATWRSALRGERAA